VATNPPVLRAGRRPAGRGVRPRRRRPRLAQPAPPAARLARRPSRRAWDGPTRCEGWTSPTWCATSLGTQFLGYTLAEAADGTGDHAPAGHGHPDHGGVGGRTPGRPAPAEARVLLTGTDEQVDAALDRLGGPGLLATAESPPGHVPAHLALAHFLFDSWVHEYDLLLPRGEHRLVDPLEARVVVGYLTGLPRWPRTALPARGTPVRWTSPDRRRPAHRRRGPRRVTTVLPGAVPAGAGPSIEGRVADVVDR